MSTWYPGGEVPPELSPEDFTPQQRELDQIGPVFRLEGDECHRWGVAVPDPNVPGAFLIERYADREHAEAMAYGRAKVEVAWAHSGRCGRGEVTPLVWQYESKGPWHFAATGWEVPA